MIKEKLSLKIIINTILYVNGMPYEDKLLISINAIISQFNAAYKNSDIQHIHREIIHIGVEKVTLSAAMSGALLFKQ